MGMVRHWQPFCLTNRVRFVAQCWYFNPQWNPVAAIKKSEHCLDCTCQLRQIAPLLCIDIYIRDLEGFSRWRWYVIAPQRNPDLQGSCSLSSHCSLSDRSKQNASKLRQFKWPTARRLKKLFRIKTLICVHPEVKTLVYRYMFLQFERLLDVK